MFILIENCNPNFLPINKKVNAHYNGLEFLKINGKE